MSKTYASHSCVSRVKSPVHSRFATYPDVSCRIWTHIRGLEVPCPFLLDEWDAAAIGIEPIFQDPKSCVLTITLDRKCTDGFEPSRMVLQTTLITRSCAQRWTVFELNELLRIFSPPLLPSQLTVLFLPDHSDDWKQDTKNSMIKSHGAIGWYCCMCPTARWIGFEPITSAFG